MSFSDSISRSAYNTGAGKLAAVSISDLANQCLRL